MTRCWSGKPAERPSMAEVVRIVSYLFQVCYFTVKVLILTPKGAVMMLKLEVNHAFFSNWRKLLDLEYCGGRLQWSSKNEGLNIV